MRSHIPFRSKHVGEVPCHSDYAAGVSGDLEHPRGAVGLAQSTDGPGDRLPRLHVLKSLPRAERHSSHNPERRANALRDPAW